MDTDTRTIDVGVASVSIQRKEITLREFSDTIKNTLANPPQSPIEAAQWMGGIIDQMASFDAVGDLSKSIASIIPGANFILPAISGVVSLFGGASLPSFEQSAIKALSAISSQISAGFADLKLTFKADLQASSRLVIDTVLQGIDTAQLETAAAQTLIALNEADLTSDLIEAKKAQYDAFMSELDEDATLIYEELENAISDAQTKLENEYKKYSLDAYKLLAPFLACVAEQMSKTDAGAASRNIVTNADAGAASRNIVTNADITGNTALVIGGAAAIAGLLLFGSKKNRK